MAVNFAAINTAYNHYLSTSKANNSTSKTAHKKSELRSVYNSIVNINKESPLYLIKNTSETRNYAVSLKENALVYKNKVSDLCTTDDNQYLTKKMAYSSDDEIVSAKFIGNISENSDIPSFEINIEQLASNQVNVGHLLPESELVRLEPDTYSFDLNVSGLNYEFQFQIHPDDTNKSVQDRLSRLIAQSDIGLSVSSISDDLGKSALKISSNQTGTTDDKPLHFQITDDRTSKTSGSVSYFGLDQVASTPQNSLFSINGVDKSTMSNQFTVEKLYEITLKNAHSEDATSTIGVKDDISNIKDNITTFIDSYNDFLTKANRTTENNSNANQLLYEMERLSSFHQNQLSSVGIDVAPNGQLTLNNALINQLFQSGEVKETISNLNDFASSTLRKADDISLNPMNYVDKKIVAYKNPGKNYCAPYITSAYSGMMFNGYC